MFQYYFFLRVLNERVFCPLSPDADGDRNLPHLVVRHENEYFQNFDTKKGHATELRRDQNFLQQLASDKANYMYKPGRSKDEPYI